MLLTIDVGNTNTVLGVFRGEELVANWRLTTARQQTVDEYGVLTRNLFTLAELGISSEALFARTAKLPRVEIKDPGKVIGTNTVTHIQAGLYYGAVDMVDGMLARIKAELGKEAVVVATGGHARLVARGSKQIQHTDEFLTLAGLRIIWDKNQAAESGKAASAPRGLRPPTQMKKAQK